METPRQEIKRLIKERDGRNLKVVEDLIRKSVFEAIKEVANKNDAMLEEGRFRADVLKKLTDYYKDKILKHDITVVNVRLIIDGEDLCL